jgi:hypothetical protein
MYDKCVIGEVCRSAAILLSDLRNIAQEAKLRIRKPFELNKRIYFENNTHIILRANQNQKCRSFESKRRSPFFILIHARTNMCIVFEVNSIM